MLAKGTTQEQGCPSHQAQLPPCNAEQGAGACLSQRAGAELCVFPPLILWLVVVFHGK